MASYCIPIPAVLVETLELNLQAPPDRVRFEHWCSEDREGGLLLLTSLFDFSSNDSKLAYYSTHINAGGQLRQYNLPLLTEFLDTIEYISPICIQGLGGDRWIVGVASSASAVDVRSGLYFNDYRDLTSPRFLANCGSRIRLRDLHSGCGTLHHNHEGRHAPARFDDAVCTYSAFNPLATKVSELGTVRLIAHLHGWNEIDFPELQRSPKALKLSKEESLGVYTDHVEALPDGGVAASIWNTAMNTLEDYYLRILGPDGKAGAVIRAVEPRARFAFSDKLGQLVVLGETSSQLFDLSGEPVANIDNPPRSKSLFRRMPLQGIWNSAGAVFVPSRLDQNNTVLVVLEPDGVGGADYLRHLHEALLEHERWVRKENKAKKPVDFRWQV